MKKHRLISRCRLAVLIVIVTAGWSGAQDDQNGATLAHWRFEGTLGGDFTEDKSEAGGCIVTGQTGSKTSTDVRLVYGEPAPDAGGKSSLFFNNKVVADNDGVFAVSEPLKEMQGMTGITAEAWIKPATIRASIIFRSIGPSGEDQLHFELRGDGSVCFRVMHMGTEFAVISPPGRLPENEWHHIAGVFGPMGLTLYIDGKFAAGRQKDKVPWPEISGSFGRLGIGAYVRNENLTSAGLFFDGQIDEIRITGRELDPAEFLTNGAH